MSDHHRLVHEAIELSLQESGYAACTRLSRAAHAAASAALAATPEPTLDADLTFRSFAATNRERCEAPDGFGHPLSGWTLSDWLLAATGEFGEAANVAKKLNRERDGIPGNTKSAAELRADLADEFADAVIYLDLAAQSQGIDLGSAVVSKFNRTSEKIGAPHRLAARLHERTEPKEEPVDDLRAALEQHHTAIDYGMEWIECGCGVTFPADSQINAYLDHLAARHVRRRSQGGTPMSEGWGDALSCDHCGHPAAYHGTTFCQVPAGGSSKRQCDCPGWKARSAATPEPTLDAATVDKAIEWIDSAADSLVGEWGGDRNDADEIIAALRALAARLHERTEP